MSIDLLHPDRSRGTVRVLCLRDVPFGQRSGGRRVARFMILAGSVYFATLLVLLTLEDRFLFPGATVARPWCEPPEYLRVRELTLASATGDQIHAWFSTPDGWEPRRGVILLSHGNGSNLSRLSGR